MVTFLLNYSVEHGLLLPGCVSGYSCSDIKLLPSSTSTAQDLESVPTGMPARFVNSFSGIRYHLPAVEGAVAIVGADETNDGSLLDLPEKQYYHHAGMQPTSRGLTKLPSSRRPRNTSGLNAAITRPHVIAAREN